MNWKKYLTLAGGAAAAVVIAYMLVREDDNQTNSKNENENENENEEEKKNSKNNKKGYKISKEELLQLLNEMEVLQTDMKNMINSLIIAAKKYNYDFMSVYNEAKTKHAFDPLIKRQMAMPDFDNALESYNFDPEVNACVQKLVRSPESTQLKNSGRPILSIEKIIEIHYYMLKELYKVDAVFQSIPNKNDLDTKSIALAIQSIVSAKVEEAFNVTSEDVELSISANHGALTSNMEFTQINVEMQTVMNKCVGESFTHFCDREDEC